MTCHLLVLDIDGTLVDSVEMHREALRRSIERAPLLHRDTDWSGYRHRTDSGIFAEAYERSFGAAPARSDCEAFERIFEREYDAVNSTRPRLIPGAIELLAQARSSCWRRRDRVAGAGAVLGILANRLCHGLISTACHSKVGSASMQ